MSENKIVLNLEIDTDEKFNISLGEIFKNLTEEQKEKLALQSLSEFFKEVEPIKFFDYERHIINIIKSNSGYWGYKNNEEIKKSENYQKEISSMMSTKEGMLNLIKKEVSDYANNIVGEYIKNDTNIQEMIDTVKSDLDKNIVKIVNEAVAAHIADQMGAHLNNFKDYVYGNINKFTNLTGGI